MLCEAEIELEDSTGSWDSLSLFIEKGIIDFDYINTLPSELWFLTEFFLILCSYES